MLDEETEATLRIRFDEMYDSLARARGNHLSSEQPDAGREKCWQTIRFLRWMDEPNGSRLLSWSVSDCAVLAHILLGYDAVIAGASSERPSASLGPQFVSYDLQEEDPEDFEYEFDLILTDLLPGLSAAVVKKAAKWLKPAGKILFVDESDDVSPHLIAHLRDKLRVAGLEILDQAHRNLSGKPERFALSSSKTNHSNSVQGIVVLARRPRDVQ